MNHFARLATSMPDRTVASLLASLLALALAWQPPRAEAQSAQQLDAYTHMSCPELESERQRLRTALVALQHPSRIDDPLWQPTSNGYGVINQLINRKCRTLSYQEQRYPDPPQVPLMPEKQLVDVAMRAVKAGKVQMGESLLLQGSLAGYASAQFNLGMLYHLLGRAEAAERWLRSAAQQGHADATRMLEAITRKK